jgi:hypothetical protein
MNVMKGIDRPALVVAIIFGIGVFLAVLPSVNNQKTETAQYITWVKEYNKRIEYFQKQNPSVHLSLYGDRVFDGTNDYEEKILPILQADELLQSLESQKPSQYQHIPIWKPVLIGLTFGIGTFAVLLFGIRLSTRGIKLLVLWIIEGFKGKYSDKK